MEKEPTLALSGNSTRGLIYGGYSGPTYTTIIQYITIASTGNSQDFGDFDSTKKSVLEHQVVTESLGWWRKTGVNRNNIEYVTIATTWKCKDFGDSNFTLIL